MEVTGSLIALISLLFLISVLSTSLSPRLGIPVLLLFLVVGMLAGEDGLLGLQFDDVRGAHLIGSAALAVILFDGGLRTDRRAFRVGLYPAFTLAGLTLSTRMSRGLYNIQRFLNGAAWFSQISMFLMLGLLVAPHELVPHALSAMGISLALAFVARPLAVYVCLLPFRFSWREQLFIAWVGLRGAVPVILALFPWIAGLENWQTYFNLTFFVVLVSLILQGWTVTPLARWLALEVPSRSGRMQRLELGLPGQEEYELVGNRIDLDSPIVKGSPTHVEWPGEARPIVAIRHGHAVDADQITTFESGDQIYLLARPADHDWLDRKIVGERDPESLGKRQFFGAFVIKPSAALAPLADIYGFKVDAETGPWGSGITCSAATRNP